MPLGLVPEVLDAIDVGPSGADVIDPVVMEFGDVAAVIDAQGIGVDDAVGLGAFSNDAHQHCGFCAGDHHRMNPAAALEQAKHRHLAGGATTARPCDGRRNSSRRPQSLPPRRGSPPPAWPRSARAACDKTASPYCGLRPPAPPPYAPACRPQIASKGPAGPLNLAGSD